MGPQLATQASCGKVVVLALLLYGLSNWNKPEHYIQDSVLYLYQLLSVQNFHPYAVDLHWKFIENKVRIEHTGRADDLKQNNN